MRFVLRTTAKRVAANVLLLGISIVCSLVAAEFLSRLVLDPVDYFAPKLVADEYLNHRIEGYTGGHDEWGFRNARRPELADIVCIGDSQTYGVSARSRESWPAMLGTLRAETVYNMGLGGYGPIQYLHLMRTRALELQPKTVIVGFYFGNDLMDVYNVVQTNKHWSYYGASSHDVLKQELAFPRPTARLFSGFRDWLSKNSILYVVITQLSIFDFVRSRELADTMKGDDNHIKFQDAKHNVMFNLGDQSRFLDMRDERIQSAMEITKKVMLELRSAGQAAHIRLIIALIPTKERVYSRLLQQSDHISRYPRLASAIEQEDVARENLIRYLKENLMEVVDLLPALDAGVAGQDLYPLTDGHPNADGYRIIAEAMNRSLNSKSSLVLQPGL